MKNKKSQELFENALKIIPLGTQTFSKSHLSYYKGDLPRFIERGEGCYVWDIDGNKYIDYINGLLPVIIGYNNKEVNDAIIGQLNKGIIFSLPHPIEYELSKKLIEIIPSAEMVRFGKSGTDATSAAIRLTRYITKREKVAICGYHGWQDWYIGSTARSGGVPDCVQRLTLKFQYNDIDSLVKLFDSHPGEIAAVIMEPMNTEFPQDNFLQKVQETCRKHSALFVLDETITGFRFNLGGAQKYFGLDPDLSAFGKSMANGMPISALVGKEKYMKKIEEIFFSGTYLGETISMASALATIKFMEKNDLHKVISDNGELLRDNINVLIKKYALEDIIQIKGHNSWQLFMFKDYNDVRSIQIKSFLQKELIENGVLWLGSFNMSFSHNRDVIIETTKIFDICLSKLRNGLDSNKIVEIIGGKEISDIFRIR